MRPDARGVRDTRLLDEAYTISLVLCCFSTYIHTYIYIYVYIYIYYIYLLISEASHALMWLAKGVLQVESGTLFKGTLDLEKGSQEGFR